MNSPPENQADLAFLQWLRHAQPILQSILDHVPALVYLKDRAGRYVFINRRFQSVVGCTPEQILGKTAYDLHSREVAETIAAHDRQVLETGTAAIFEEEIVVAGKKQRYASVKFPVQDREGTIYGIGGVAAEAASRPEARPGEHGLLREILDRMPVMVTVWDASLRLLLANQEFRRLTGWSSEEVAGNEFLPRCFPNLSERERARDYMVSLRPGWKDFPIATKHGEILETEWANVTLSDTLRIGVGLDTGARKRAEEALRRSETEFRAIFEFASSGKALVDPITRRFLRVNPRFCEMTGYPEAELLAKTSIELTHPEDRARDQATMAAVLSGQSDERQIEKRYVRKDGTTRWVLVTGRLLRDVHGHPQQMIATVQDITERKQAEAALREKDERLRESEAAARKQLTEIEAIYASAPVGLCVLDRDLRFQRINRWLAEMNGHPAEAHIGRTVRDVVPGIADQAEVLAQRVFTGETLLGIEIAGETAAQPGVRRHWIEHWLPLRDPAGDVVGINVVAEEVTQRYRAQEALRQSEERLRMAAWAANFGIYDFDFESGAGFWSRELRALAGLGADAAIPFEADGTPSVIHPEDRERFATAVRAALDPGGSGEIEDRHRILRPDGTTRWVYVRGKTFFVGDGAARRPKRAMGTVIDITMLTQTEEALEAANRYKDEFLALLGHELRNPLAPIMNAVRLLALHGGENPRVRWAIEIMERQIRQVQRLVDDLLDVSRINRGMLELRREPLDLRDVVTRAIEMTHPTIEARKHALTVSLPSEPLRLDGDADRLTQVVTNLLTNAARYTPEGGQISLAVTREADEAVVRVRDTGIGIAGEEFPRLFDPFRQLHRAEPQARAGLGLGLTLVKRLVEMHGGTVQATSPGRGQGSEFSVRLPALPPA